MRRIALLSAAVGLLVFAAAAWAVTNTVSYTVTLKKVGSGKPTPKKPHNLAYNAKLHIDTTPPGEQPETAPVTSIYFPKQIKQNAKLLPGCSVGDIDGKPSFPSKCNKAKVGSGTATALAGTPGADASTSVKEDLNVTAVNGLKGKQILLVLNSTPTAPVAITNRVVPGDLAPGTGAFGYRVDFKIPANLQNQLGLSISLTDFNVSIPAKTFKVKKKKISFLQVTGCGSLPIRAIAHFIDANGNPTTDVPNDSVAKC